MFNRTACTDRSENLFSSRSANSLFSLCCPVDILIFGEHSPPETPSRTLDSLMKTLQARFLKTNRRQSLHLHISIL